jgi:hypothetical protein
VEYSPRSAGRTARRLVRIVGDGTMHPVVDQIVHRFIVAEGTTTDRPVDFPRSAKRII